MEYILKKIKDFNHKITFKSLETFVDSLEISKINYQNFIYDPLTLGDYGRNIITIDPFECVLINWPPGIESSVHHHKGLFGYVIVLEGELDNISYKEEKNKIIEFKSEKYFQNGVMPEPDGVIHKLANNNTNQRAVTLHFYYPAIKSFEGMRIFNLKTKSKGVLSKNAQTAKWSNDKKQFKKIENNSFDFVSLKEINKSKSHIVQYVYPKPDAFEIKIMNSKYFSEQAQQYDFSDFNQPSRKAYINAIDELIANDLALTETSKHLDIATGTGRRAIRIKDLSGLDYEIVGVEISEEMSKLASSRGIRMYHQDWVNNDEPSGDMFSSASFLYAFGHIGNTENRIKYLNKINSYLNKDAPFYIDFFSLNNINEWGPLARKSFENNNLSKYGYDLGDVFYKKNGCNELAFLHYFEKKEIVHLFDLTGFKISWIKNIGYSKNPGELVNSEKEGNILIKALKI